MISRCPGARTLVRAVAIALLAALLSPAYGGDNLVENSPFVPQGWEPPRQPERRPDPRTQRDEPRPLDQIEFRGITTFNGEEMFSIHDPTSDRSFWLGLDQTEAGFTVARFNPGDDTVVIRHDGESREIPLHEAEIQSPSEPREAPRPRGRGGRDRRERQVEEDPEERMQSLAEEIRRRRELRREILERSQGNDQSHDEEQQQSGGQAPPLPN